MTILYLRKLLTNPKFLKYQVRDVVVVPVREKLPQRFHQLGPKSPCPCYRCYE